MLTLAAAETLGSVAATTNVISMTIFGMELNAGVESYETLYQGRITNSVATNYTVPTSTETFIKSIHLANTSASEVTGVQLLINGATSAQRICSLAIPANGWATYGEDGWRVYDDTGQLQVRTSGIPNTEGVQYFFDAGTTITDPGLAEFSFNNATILSATKMCLSKTANNGGSGSAQGPFMEALFNNKSALIRIGNLLRDGYITVIVHRVVADNTTWFELDVTVIGNTLAPVVATSYYMTFHAAQAGWAGEVKSQRFNYLWSTTTTNTPAAGTVRLNTTTPHTATDSLLLYIADTDNDGNNVREFWNSLKIGSELYHSTNYVSFYTSDASADAQRFRIQSVSVSNAWIQLTVTPLNPSSTMPSNAAAITLQVEHPSTYNSDSVQANGVVANAGLYGMPGHIVGGAITNYAWGTAARLRGFVISVKHPIFIKNWHVICSLQTSGSSNAKFGYHRCTPLRGGGFKLGANIGANNFTNLLAATGLKTQAVNDVLWPGYYFVWLALATLAQNPQVHALLTTDAGGMNFNGGVNPMLFTSEFFIAVDHTGAAPTEGTTVSQTTAGLGTAFAASMQLPFWMNWHPLA